MVDKSTGCLVKDSILDSIAYSGSMGGNSHCKKNVFALTSQQKTSKLVSRYVFLGRPEPYLSTITPNDYSQISRLQLP